MIYRGSSPTHPGLLDPLQAFLQAASLHEQQRLGEAVRLYEIVLKTDDRHFDSLCRLGVIRLQQNRFADAVQLFRRAVNVDPESADAHHHLAVALTGLDRLDEAIHWYERALLIKPNFSEARNNLGYALQKLGRHEDAAAQYEEALAINPAYAEARNNLGNALQMLGRSEAALMQFEKAIALKPDHAEAYNNLGNVLSALHRYDEAIAYYGQAIAVKPHYAGAYLNLGSALGAIGQDEQAIANYEKALAIAPGDAEVHFRLGSALTAITCHEEAIAEYDKALAIDPGHAGALAGRGTELIMRGQYDEAAALLNDLVARGLGSSSIYLAIANLPASFITIDLLTELDKLTKQQGEDQATFDNFVAFARAAALDKAGRYTEAWEHLVLANRSVFLSTQSDLADAVARQRANLARLRENPAKPADGNAEGGRAISLFILGPSRSGKTTMEMLVGTLEAVRLGYENPTVRNAVSLAFETGRLPANRLLENLPPALHSVCRETYINELTKRVGPAKVFTSTNPGLIHTADLIASILPNTRFILVKRDLQDNLLRIYQWRYKRGNLYSYDLMTARDHLVWYHQMMDLFAEKFSDIARVIHYEDIVSNPTAATRMAAELCGLPVPGILLPSISDDRACAAPYRQLMASALER